METEAQETEIEEVEEQDNDFMGFNRFNPKKVNLLEPTF